MSSIALNVAPITSLAHYMLNGQEKKGGQDKKSQYNVKSKIADFTATQG